MTPARIVRSASSSGTTNSIHTTVLNLLRPTGGGSVAKIGYQMWRLFMKPPGQATFELIILSELCTNFRDSLAFDFLIPVNARVSG